MARDSAIIIHYGVEKVLMWLMKTIPMKTEERWNKSICNCSMYLEIITNNASSCWSFNLFKKYSCRWHNHEEFIFVCAYQVLCLDVSFILFVNVHTCNLPSMLLNVDIYHCQLQTHFRLLFVFCIFCRLIRSCNLFEQHALNFEEKYHKNIITWSLALLFDGVRCQCSIITCWSSLRLWDICYSRDAYTCVKVGDEGLHAIHRLKAVITSNATKARNGRVSVAIYARLSSVVVD